VKSGSGVPPSASTPKTADQLEQNNCRPWPPSGNRTSTENSPYAATALAQTHGNIRLVDPLKITSAKIDIACLQHTLFVGMSRQRRACERQCQLKRLDDQRLRPDQMGDSRKSRRTHRTACGSGEP
jgi:hypothetical protein